MRGRRPRPIRTAMVMIAAVLGAVGIGAVIFRPALTSFASSTPKTDSAVPRASSPTLVTKPETPAASASVPYRLELSPRPGAEPQDIVIRIRPSAIDNAASTPRAALPNATKKKVAKKSSVWPPKMKPTALEPALP